MNQYITPESNITLYIKNKNSGIKREVVMQVLVLAALFIVLIENAHVNCKKLTRLKVKVKVSQSRRFFETHTDFMLHGILSGRNTGWMQPSHLYGDLPNSGLGPRSCI